MFSLSIQSVSELTTPNLFSIYLLSSPDEAVEPLLSEALKARFLSKIQNNKSVIIFEDAQVAFVLPSKDISETYLKKEYFRKKGHELFQYLSIEKISQVAVLSSEAFGVYEFVEGLSLSSYKFDKYKSQKTTAGQLSIYVDKLSSTQINKLKVCLEAVQIAKDWVNEPVIHLTAEQFSDEIVQKCSTLPYTKIEVFNKQKIEALKMGGLLAINKGAPNPPTFTVLEYKHPKANHTQPIALVGKGVVFDTGGLSLKETANSMDLMKCDMAGAAAVVGAFFAAAKLELTLHLMVFIPATENRPDGNAIVPSDIITMYNGKTVEILNTDAEGRVILGDALAYADKFDPELVIDLATLTGAAIAAIGKEAAVMVGNASKEVKTKLLDSGFDTYERMIEFPLWDEYMKDIESDIADIKNIGTGAGAITAAAFLKHFTTKPWIHLDIAGPAYVKGADAYRSKYATAYGVRLLVDFLSNY
ncbi:MAG: leucyl aminopeptidase family protein [Cytophagales bacterium]